MSFLSTDLQSPPSVKGSAMAIQSRTNRILSNSGTHGHGIRVASPLVANDNLGRYYWEVFVGGYAPDGKGAQAGMCFGIAKDTASVSLTQTTFPYDINPSDSYVLCAANRGVGPELHLNDQTDRVVFDITGSEIKRFPDIPDNANRGWVLRFAFDATNAKLWMGDELAGWYGVGDPEGGNNPTVSGIDMSTDWYPYAITQSAAWSKWIFAEPFLSENPFMPFLEVQFPTTISFNSRTMPTFSTTITRKGDWFEQRNRNWKHSRHRYDISTGIRTMAEWQQVVDFFQGLHGAWVGFRFKDWTDFKSVRPDQTTSGSDIDLDQLGDGFTKDFPLEKYYPVGATKYARRIRKPVNGTIAVEKEGVPQTEGSHYTLDYTTGILSFGAAPLNSQTISWGGEFDVPVRLSDDSLSIDWTAPFARRAEVILQEIRG